MATPLTTVAAFLRANYNLTAADASANVWGSLSLAQQNVWTFNALNTALTSQIPFRLVDALWLVRQMQAQTAVTCLKDAYATSDEDKAAVSLAAYAARFPDKVAFASLDAAERRASDFGTVRARRERDDAARARALSESL